MAQKKRDLLVDHQEWIEHQYNKGYWINRISWADIGRWRFIRRHNRVLGGQGMLASGVLISAALITLPERMAQLQAQYEKYADFPGLTISPPSYFNELSILIPFLFIFFFSLILAFQKPEQPTRQENPASGKKKRKKKLPRRRKDYQ